MSLPELLVERKTVSVRTRLSLALFALTLPLLSGCGAHFVFFNSIHAKEDRELTTAHVPGSAIDVKTGLGSIKIKTDPGAKEVRVLARITVHAETQEKADALLPDVKVVLERRADKTLEVRSEFPKQESGYGYACAFEIVVPEANGSKTHTGNGSIHLDGLGGTSDADTGIGSVTVLNQKGKVVAKTGNGSIKVENAQGEVVADTSIGAVTVKSSKGNVTVKTGNGSIDLDQTHGTVEAKTSIGSIKVKESTGDVTAKSGNGSVTVTGAKGPVKAHSNIGQVKVENASAAIDAETGNGSIDCIPTADNKGPFRLHTGIGSIQAHVPGKWEGKIEAHAGIGRVQIHGENKARAIKGEKHDKTVEMSDGGEKSTARTGNGSIMLMLD